MNVKYLKYLLYAVVMTPLVNCSSYNSVIVGNMPKDTKCLAIMPFVPGGELNKKDGELLSAFLASDIFKEGREGLIYPKEIRAIYKQLKVEYPDVPNSSYASKFGNSVGADSVVWGSLSFRTIVEKEGEVEVESRLISVEAFLIKSKTREVNWFYDTKKITTSEATIKTLANISSEMKYGLLRKTSSDTARDPKACFKSALAQRLATFLAVPVRPTQRKEKEQVRADIAEVRKEKELKLNEEEMSVFNKLKKNKSLNLDGLKFDGRTQNISKDGILYLSRLVKVLMAIGKNQKFVFESHVDATNDTADDMQLSLARVRNVKSYLLKYPFFNTDIVEIKAKGGQVPIMPNLNERSREKNRRIILKIEKLAK